MRKILALFLFLVFGLSIVSCAAKIAPSIRYENDSYNGGIVRNIKVEWVKVKPLGASTLNFCGIQSGIYNIKRNSDFFGPVHIEWENAEGKKLTKDLIFTKDKLPSIRRRSLTKKHIFVELHFTQDDVHILTYDTPNLKQERADLLKKAGLTCQEYRDREYIKIYGRKCLEEGCDDVITMYDSMPADSPLKKDPKFLEEYKQEKAKRAANN
ncbi:MAG: hypothetical protein ACJAW3_001002 [Lentimonas sp.]|jgi:hypothetical protein